MRKLIFILALAAPAAAQQTPQYQARIPGLSSTNGVASFSTPAQAAGLQDTLSQFPLNSWSCANGADESVNIANCISADMTANILGRVYVSSPGGTQAWSQNPFAPLTDSSSPSYQMWLNPTQQVTANAEIWMGTGTTVDGRTGYAGGGGPGTGGAFITAGSSLTTLFADGWSATPTQLTQGDKIQNLGLDAGALGQTAMDFSRGQEGTQVRNIRAFGFQVCFNRDATASTGGAFHNFGVFDYQCELGDDTDSTVWGERFGYNTQGAGEGLLQNADNIGGANPNGTTKIGIENDGSNLHVLGAYEESLTYGYLYNAVHSNFKSGNLAMNIECLGANAPTPICVYAKHAGADQGSTWIEVSGPDTVFYDLAPPVAVVRNLHTDGTLGFYSYDSGNDTGHATVLTNSPQLANVNLKSGDSYSNNAAWPSTDLPAKTVSQTISGTTAMGTQYMTTSDVSAGLLPEGLAYGFDLQAQTGATVHVMSVMRHGPANCIFDGATTANDYVVGGSSAWNSTSAVPCHDTGSSTPPATGPYIGKVQLSVASAPSAPSAPTVTTNCTGTCSTTYSYEWVVKATNDPLDHTQSAGSTAGTVSSAATLSTSTSNTIGGCSAGSAATPCELFETAGPYPGWLLETINTSSVTDSGLQGVPLGGAPYSVGIIDPPVHVELGQSGAAIATSSSLGVVQPDNSTITINGSGVISTAAGSVLPYYWNQQSSNGSQDFAATANTQYAWPFLVTGQVGFKQMCIFIAAADASTSDYYNVALVKLSSPSCTGAGCATTTLAQWGPTNITVIPTSKYLCEPNSGGGTATITPGLYYVVTTGGPTATATFETGNSTSQQLTPLTATSAGTSSSGTFGTITLSVATSGAGVITGGAGPIQFGLSQ